MQPLWQKIQPQKQLYNADRMPLDYQPEPSAARLLVSLRTAQQHAQQAKNAQAADSDHVLVSMW